MWIRGTVIVAFHSLGGFVVAADGRASTMEGVFSDETQKLFALESPDMCLAYAFAGLQGLRKQGANQWGRTFMGEEDLAEVAAKRYADPRVFIKKVGRKIHENLWNAERELELVGQWPNDDGRGTIAELLLAGYYGQSKVGVMAKVRWLARPCTHEAGKHKLVENPSFKVKVRPSVSEHVVCGGADGILDLLLADDQRLSEFHTTAIHKFTRQEGLSLDEARQLAASLVGACCSPLAHQLNHKNVSCGGRIHIATVTREQGFQWAIPPAGVTC